MPFVIQQFEEQPICILSGTSALAAAAGVLQQFRGRLGGTSALDARGGNLTRGAGHISGASSLYAFGRIGSEANKFGASNLTGNSNLTSNARAVRNGVAVLSGNSNLTARPFVSVADRSTLNLFITIAPDFVRPFAAVYSARVITSAAVTIPIKDYSYNESAQTAGIDANFTLTKVSDRSEIEAATGFKFEIYDRGAWVEMFSAGRLSQNSFSFSWSDMRPQDSAAFSTAAPIAAKMDTAPELDLTIYDPSRLTVNSSDFPNRYDTLGNAYPHQVRAVSNLTLYDLFHFVAVEIFGFSNFKSNINDFAVRRADFVQTESYLDGIAGHIGIFRPVFYVRDNVFWILSSMLPFPEGFAAPLELRSDRIKSGSLSAAFERIDGYILRYSQDERDYDYVTTELVPLPTETEGGSFGDPSYSEIFRTQTIRKYFKSSSPFVPVRTEKLSEKTEVRATVAGALTTVSTETEQYFYNSFGLATQIKTDGFALVPNMSDPDFTNNFTRSKAVIKQFFYNPDRFDPRRQVLAGSKTDVSGLIATDTQNQQLGKDFRQELTNDAFRAGNLKEGMTVDFGAIRTIAETISQTAPGQFEIRSRTSDFLTDPPTVDHAPTESRAGDASINATTTAQSELTVLRPGAIRQNARLKTLTIAELPTRYGISLAQTRLANPNPKSGSITLIGIDLSLRRGAIFTLFDRDDNQVGNFLIEGFQITGKNLGRREQVSEQVLQVIEIPTVPGTNNNLDTGAIRVAPGADKTFTLQIAGHTDFFISAVVPGGVTISAKLEIGDSYQDLSSDPLDTSSFAGLTKTVYFKIEADSMAAPRDDTAQIIVSLI